MMSIQLTLAAKTEVGGHRSGIGSHWEENCFNIAIKLEVKNKKVLKFSRGVMHAALIRSVTENTLLPPQI